MTTAERLALTAAAIAETDGRTFSIAMNGETEPFTPGDWAGNDSQLDAESEDPGMVPELQAIAALEVGQALNLGDDVDPWVVTRLS